MNASVKSRIGRCNMSILLTPTAGVVHGPLYNHGFRCCSRSPLLTNAVYTTVIGNVRDGSINASLGRFTLGGRRAGHAHGGIVNGPHAFHRVCLGPFRVIVGRTRP